MKSEKTIIRLYDLMAPFYGPAWRAIRPWWQYSAAALPWLPERGAVLEIGPGPGLLHEQLARRCDLLVGLDISAGMLHRTKARLAARYLPVRLVRGDAQSLPFARASFDAIVMTFVFSAIPDGERAMREFARVLRPGGVLVIVDACIPADRNTPARVLARMWTLFGDQMRDEAALMRTAGLKVMEKREFGAFHSIRLTAGRKNQALGPGVIQ